MKDFVLTSESVTPGHPDKLCDQISDAIVDRQLNDDPLRRVTAECAMASGIVFLAVQAGGPLSADPAALAREVVEGAGYDETAFNARDISVLSRVSAGGGNALPRGGVPADLKPDRSVTVFGYACRQTPQLMPLPIMLAHGLCRRLSEMNAGSELDSLHPDGQVQVAVEFRNRRPRRVRNVSLSLFPQEGRTLPAAGSLLGSLRELVIEPVLAASGDAFRGMKDVPVNLNLDGPGGGPINHAGLTGRKTAIDAYGAFVRHSGSALSGKDPYRIERLSACAARHAAVNIVAADLAEECEVLLSYAVGQTEPVSLEIDTFGSGILPDKEVSGVLRQVLDLRPGGVVRRLGLAQCVQAHDGCFFQKLAVFGQMGRDDPAPPWEATDAADDLRAAANA